MHLMHVISPTAKYEVPDLEALDAAVTKADLEWGLDPGSEEKKNAWLQATRDLAAAVPPVVAREAASTNLQALLAGAITRGKREAVDEYDGSQIPPCEMDGGAR